MHLAVGIMLILLSIVHVIYGEKVLVQALGKTGADGMLVGALRVMSLQGGLILLAIGVTEVLIFAGTIELTGFAAYIPLGIICLNLLSVFIVAFAKHRELIKNTVPQLIIFAVVVLLLALSL